MPLAPRTNRGSFFSTNIAGDAPTPSGASRVVGDETSALRPLKDVAAPGCKIPLARTRTASGKPMLCAFGKPLIRFRHPEHHSLSFANSHVIANGARFPRTSAQTRRFVEDAIGAV